MKEKQNIEWKESWRDEYLKWICGFANAYFLTGDIEASGRGIDTIRDACRENATDFPTFKLESTGMMVEFKGVVPDKARQKPPPVTPQVEAHDEAQEAQVRAHEVQAGLTTTETCLLQACSKEPQDGRALLAAAGYSSRTGNFKRSLDKLLEAGLIEMTIPDRPRSSRQKYRLTKKGRAALESLTISGS